MIHDHLSFLIKTQTKHEMAVWGAMFYGIRACLKVISHSPHKRTVPWCTRRAQSGCLAPPQMSGPLGWCCLLFLMSCASTKAQHLELPCGPSIWPAPCLPVPDAPKQLWAKQDESFIEEREGTAHARDLPDTLIGSGKKTMNMHEALSQLMGADLSNWVYFPQMEKQPEGFLIIKERKKTCHQTPLLSNSTIIIKNIITIKYCLMRCRMSVCVCTEHSDVSLSGKGRQIFREQRDSHLFSESIRSSLIIVQIATMCFTHYIKSLWHRCGVGTAEEARGK